MNEITKICRFPKRNGIFGGRSDAKGFKMIARQTDRRRKREGLLRRVGWRRGRGGRGGTADVCS